MKNIKIVKENTECISTLMLAIKKEFKITNLIKKILLTKSKDLNESAEQLHQSRSFLEAIIENIPNMIFVKDAKDLRFVRFNRAGEILLGHKREELVGKNDYDFFSKEEADFFTLKDREVLTSGGIHDIPEEKISTADGFIRYLHTKKIPVYDKDNKPLFLLGISEDITDKKLAETQKHELLQAQMARSEAERTAKKMAYLMEAANEASRAKSTFLANISHEIRTPLGAMLGFTDLILEDKNLSSEYRQYLSTIERNGRQLLRLVDEILDLSKVESEHMQLEILAFDLVELVNDVTDSLSLKARSKSLYLMTTFKKPIHFGVMSDPSRLRQIMVNIIGNAIKFTEKGGIHVEVDLTENDDQKSGELTIEVQDTGIGLEPEKAELLFQPFAQADQSMNRRFGGTGLGLFLSRKIARLMGGDVILYSTTPNEGSLFRVNICVDLIPLKANKLKPTISMEKNLTPLKSRVLIVDDAVDNRFLLEMLLQKYNIDTVTANNGSEAVEIALMQSFDLILMDVQMPIMDGFEAVKYLRSKNYKQPVIALTAHAMRGDRERCIETGFDDYIKKPINREALEECLSRFIKKVNENPSTPFSSV